MNDMNKAAGLPPEWQTPVPSPCISLCEMAPDTGLCRGCLRTIDEIVAWGSASDATRRAIYSQIRRREAELGFD
jgi:predicted Fe-S protein YdhL (DUF1289 family)